MGRSIKFRAWNDTQKTMGEAFALQDAIERRRDGVRTGDVIYMQFTGIMDKNGVPIYEGDICIIGDGGEFFGQDYGDDDFPFDTDKFQIYWEDEAACFYIKSPDGKERDLEFSPFGYARFEVIGNIHEHPELLVMSDPRTNLKLKPAYSAKLEALMPAYRARSKAHLLEMLIDDAQRKTRPREDKLD